ncbi:MAG: threonine/serine exporter family protein [Phycisphaerales bacterium]|nr:threonine/serine exporter family protein [Planctomycetota bacterium]MBL6997192.1 threonine/serine exporter family protein [Phycisphaerales bacterium]
MTNLEREQILQLIIELAKTLHTLGTPAHRLECAVNQAGEALGIQVSLFSVPTSLMLSFGEPDDMQTAIIRVEPGFIDLARLSKVDKILNQILIKTIANDEALKQLKQVLSEPQEWGGKSMIFGFTLAGCAAARFFGGGLSEIIVAGVAGLVVGFIMLLPRKRPEREPLADLLAAAAASFLAWISTLIVPSLSPSVVVLAAIVVLLPGLTLTLSLNELATRHLASGSARLMQALMGFLALAIGSLIGENLALCIPNVHSTVATPLEPWTFIPALLLSGIALSVLFDAKMRDMPWIIISGVLGFACARFGGESLGPELGVTIGAFMVGISGNLYRRILDAPSATLTVPGIMLLVPGGLGLQSVEHLVESKAAANMNLVMTVFIIAAGLVTGLLFANLVLPARKHI